MVVFNKYSDSNLGSLMKEPRSNLVSGVVSLVETMESVDFIGISDINYENDFQNNLKKMIDKKGANFCVFLTTEWDFQKQETTEAKTIAAWTLVASTLLNMDEFVTRQ